MTSEVGKLPAYALVRLGSLKRVRWSEFHPVDQPQYEALVALGLAEGKYRTERKEGEYTRVLDQVRRTEAGQALVTVLKALGAPLRAKAAAALVLNGASTAEEVAGMLGCTEHSAEVALRDLARHGYAHTTDGRYKAAKEDEMAKQTAQGEKAAATGGSTSTARKPRETRKPLTRAQAEKAMKENKAGSDAYQKARADGNEREKAKNHEAYKAYKAAYRDLLAHKRAAGELPPAGSRASTAGEASGDGAGAPEPAAESQPAEA